MKRTRRQNLKMIRIKRCPVIRLTVNQNQTISSKRKNKLKMRRMKMS